MAIMPPQGPPGPQQTQGKSPAPNYRPSQDPEGKGCNPSCGSYAQMGGQHICKQFKFNCDPKFICDAWNPSQVYAAQKRIGPQRQGPGGPPQQGPPQGPQGPPPQGAPQGAPQGINPQMLEMLKRRLGK